MGDTSDNDDAAPKLPAVSTTNTDEEIKTKAIIGWITGFLLSLQARYYISYAAMNLLIKFFSPFVAKLEKKFFTSFDVMCKSIDFGHSFTKYVVCPNCNQIYTYEQCFDVMPGLTGLAKM